MTLVGTLTATDEDDHVVFQFTVENTGSSAVDLQFSDAQRFDVVVERDGEQVWRYAEGMMFAQMLQTETLAPGETVEFEAEWDDPSDGEFEARATLTASGVDCEATTSVTV